MDDDNGNGRITLAVLGNKVENLAAEWHQWRVEDADRERLRDAHGGIGRARTLKSERDLATSIQDRADLRTDVAELKGDMKVLTVRELTWDLGNTVAGIVLGLLVYFKKIGL